MNWVERLIERLLSIFPRIQMVNPDEAGCRITLGSHVRPIGPGWYIYWPILQEMAVIPVQSQAVDMRPQSVYTKDGRDLCISGGIMYRVVDAVKAQLSVQDYDKSLYTLALGIVTDYINQHDFKDCNVSGIREAVLKGVREDAAGFGLKIMRMYITDYGTAKNIRILGGTVVSGGAVEELE